MMVMDTKRASSVKFTTSSRLHVKLGTGMYIGPIYLLQGLLINEVVYEYLSTPSRDANSWVSSFFAYIAYTTRRTPHLS